MASHNPKCTLCGYELDEEDTWYGGYTVGEVSKGDGDVSELNCPDPDCGGTFYTRCVHHIRFEQAEEDGDDL